MIDEVLTPLYQQIRARAHRGTVLVDGLVVPVGERNGTDGLFSDKKGFRGQNVQVVANLAGRLAHVGDLCPGATHDSRAFRESGIATRWEQHYQPGGRGLTGDKGHEGTGITIPYKKPPGRELTEARRACNQPYPRRRQTPLRI